MSLESARLFVEKMKTDEEFAKKVTECKDAEARRELVLASGFDFTNKELSQVTDHELDRDTLDSIAAGRIICPGCGTLCDIPG